MPGKISVIILLFLTTLALADNGGREIKADRARLLQTITDFYDAIENADHEKRIELFADDAIMMPDAWTIIRGKNNIAESIRRGKDSVFKLRDINRLELTIGGKIAYTVNEYYYTWHAVGDDPVWKKTKNVHIWRKQPDGSWKLQVDIWNSTPES